MSWSPFFSATSHLVASVSIPRYPVTRTDKDKDKDKDKGQGQRTYKDKALALPTCHSIFLLALWCVGIEVDIEVSWDAEGCDDWEGKISAAKVCGADDEGGP